MPSEIESNFSDFIDYITVERTNAESALGEYETDYLNAYSRLLSLNAWSAYVIESTQEHSCASFFAEALNDAVISFVHAYSGSWRSSLQSLRSCIENILTNQYYKDHPVELAQWKIGYQRLAFTELVNYFLIHPKVKSFSTKNNGLLVIKKEYATLSRAVHGSAESFRMIGEEGETQIWQPEKAKLGSWVTRQRAVLRSLNLFLISMYHEQLKGTAFPGLREAIGHTLNTATLKKLCLDHYGISL